MTELTANIPAGVVLAVAVVVWIASSARLTRLFTQDTFPPVVWARTKWDEYTEDTAWNTLLHCHWCLSVWVTPAVGAWGWLSNLHWTWWVFNFALAASYASAMIVERDEVG